MHNIGQSNILMVKSLFFEVASPPTMTFVVVEEKDMEITHVQETS